MSSYHKKQRPKHGFPCFRTATFLVTFCIGLVLLSFSSLDKNEIAIRYATKSSHPSNRYVLYDSRYGSLNNQLNSLFNSLVIAKQLNATLVLGYAYTPGGGYALRDDGRSNHSYLVGHYFDAKLLNSVQPIIFMDEYLQLDRARHPLPFYVDSAQESTRNGNYYRQLGLNITIHWLTKKQREDPPHSPQRQHVCEQILGRGKKILQQKDCRDILLGFSFTNLYNCTWYDEWWYAVRRFVQPKSVILQSVRTFVQRVRHPLVVVHVRYVGGSDAPNNHQQHHNNTNLRTDHSFYETIYQHLKRYNSHHHHHSTIGSIYVVGMKDKRQAIRVDGAIDYLSKKLPQVDWYTCANLTNCAESYDRNSLYEEDMSAFRGYYSVILLDQWMGVESDYFLGRSASTFSQNIVYWKQLKGETTNHYLLY
ncbi:hypothetical protein GAYE_SCF65G6765 [Galdieria yellowstonensis]|uniref:GDP-fucose protein O-fucosyltransferase 2 n=1 Tax=Galdieria yellowstonensis TaxID=3028027 RepID=A0AAV9INF8_9RHOD|nr:hypothetical protein GAYE_SCF65G6765 [Galdieria yellowstonensis]